MPPQAVGGGGYYVFSMPRCPNVPYQHRHFFALRKYLTGFGEIWGK